jgi:2-polyprenyl-3-methyl-5-hydroxy-6-metoxy-1,4-benzoquinol methylase
VALSYDRALVAAAYDEFGEQEWDRHERAPFHRVAFHLHRHYLAEFVHRGDRVLEVGAASGRFTVELARLGASIVVTDISPGQLELNVAHIAEAGLESAVESRALADIVGLSTFEDGAFDAVVCYGGPLSHVMERADQALDELLRVTKPGGHVLLGVMSLHGSLHAFLAGADAEIEEFGIDEMQAIFESGDLPSNHSQIGTPMHLFSWDDLRALLERHDCDVVVASAANFLSIGNDEICNGWLHDEVIWERFLQWEIASCAQPGAIDGGTHIIAVVRAR